jgi:hypothetical protein
MSLYGLFGFSEEERKQLNAARKRKKSLPAANPRQLDLFSQTSDNHANAVKPNTPNPAPVYPIYDERKEELDWQQREQEKPRSWSGILQEHHRQGSLVMEQNGQVGVLQERYRDNSVFKPLKITIYKNKRQNNTFKSAMPTIPYIIMRQRN